MIPMLHYHVEWSPEDFEFVAWAQEYGQGLCWLDPDPEVALNQLIELIKKEKP